MENENIEIKQLNDCLKIKSKQNDEYNVIASTNDLDRDNEIVEPAGVVNLDFFLKNNPVLLFNHNWYGKPVGKILDASIENNKLIMKLKFADTEEGQEIKYLYDDGFMNSFSIGFRALEWNDKKVDNIDIRTFTKWELFELSAVTIPANRFANILRSSKKELCNLKSLYDKGFFSNVEKLDSDINEIKNNFVDLATIYKWRSLWIR